MTPLEFYRDLRAKGLSEDDAFEMASKFEASVTPLVTRSTASKLSPGAQRTRRYRERLAAKDSVTARVTERHEVREENVTVTDGDEKPLSPALPPQTPLTHPHTPESNTTREGLFADDPAEKKPKAKRAPNKLPEIPMPPDWEPDASERTYATNQGMTPDDIRKQTIEFREHHLDKQNRRPGWTLSWQRWCRQWVEFGKRGSRVASRPTFSGGGRSEPTDFASIIARDRGYVQD